MREAEGDSILVSMRIAEGELPDWIARTCGHGFSINCTYTQTMYLAPKSHSESAAAQADMLFDALDRLYLLPSLRTCKTASWTAVLMSSSVVGRLKSVR